MSSALKGFLLVLGGLALFIGVIIGGISWWLSEHKAELIAEAKRVEDEGVAYAKGQDSKACLQAGVARLKSCDKLVCRTKAKMFFRACVRAAKPQPDFCSDVPRPGGFMDTVTWRVAQCSAAGMDPKHCQGFFEELQLHCHRGTRP